MNANTTNPIHADADCPTQDDVIWPTTAERHEMGLLYNALTDEEKAQASRNYSAWESEAYKKTKALLREKEERFTGSPLPPDEDDEASQEPEDDPQSESTPASLPKYTYKDRDGIPLVEVRQQPATCEVRPLSQERKRQVGKRLG